LWYLSIEPSWTLSRFVGGKTLIVYDPIEAEKVALSALIAALVSVDDGATFQAIANPGTPSRKNISVFVC